jgi:transcriptional regulator with XRE-family HTH domain
MGELMNQLLMAKQRKPGVKRLPICVRTKDAREAAGYVDRQAEFAVKLGIESGTYNKYETRSPIKQEFIAKFCDLTGVREKWLLTGELPMKEDSQADPLAAIKGRLRLPGSREKIERVFKELQDAEKIILGDEGK